MRKHLAPGPLCTLSPTDVFDLASATAALGLDPSSLSREVRQGRLKVSKRCGRYFVTGKQLLDWLQAGERTAPQKPHANGETVP